jgi:hypothetical protein
MRATLTVRMRLLAVAGAALLVAGVLIATVTASAGAARHASAAKAPAADCQPFSSTPCLLPFPNNLFTRPDKTSATGLRVKLPAGAMPVDTAGQRISAAPYDRNDGFSPGSVVIVHVPGLDNAGAFTKTGAAPLTNIGASLKKSQPIVVLDASNGQRQAVWSELDANATTPQTTNLMIHGAKMWLAGHTYVVVLRNLKTSGGGLIKAPSWFEKLRDGKKLPKNERSQAGVYKKIFKSLKKAKIAQNKTLYQAWEFTVASRQNLTGRLLAIRNNAFAQLGDTNLADGTVQGNAPAFTVTSSGPAPSGAPAGMREVKGTFTVPCYLVTCGATATTGFHYSSSKPDATPTQIPGNQAAPTFDCIIPASATPLTPARISLYGHGLLGSQSEVEAGNVEDMANEHNMVFCATDWWGLAQGDIPGDVNALKNLNLFPNVIDRLQQGVLNFMFLGRAMLNSKGFVSNAAFELAGQPVIETSNLYYDGNSQGGIEGGLLTAVEPDVRRAVLGVTGIDYGGLLLLRSTDFAEYAALIFPSYPDASMHPVLLDLMDQLWDRGEPDGYAQWMTTHPLPDTPSHTVLMQIAYGDFQVSMYSGATEARTIGASVYEPALDPDRSRDKNLFYGLPSIKSFPFNGSAIEIWDSGAGRVQDPPLTDTAPVASATGATNNINIDPHEDVRDSPEARVQKSDFLVPNGAVTDVCGGSPCHTSIYTP